MQHTHRLSLALSLVYLVGGAFGFLIGLVLLADGIGLIPIEEGQSPYASLAMAALMLPLCSAAIANALVTRFVVKPEGIELHTINYILRAQWSDLVNVADYLVPRAGRLYKRQWTRPFWKLFHWDPDNVQILISLFGRFNGHPLEDDITANIMQVGPHADQ